MPFTRWADEMEEHAIGFCRLTAHEFGEMTAREFWWRYEAEIERETRSMKRTAQLACWVISPWLKSPITVEKLMPSQPVEPAKPWTTEDWKAWAQGKR